MDGDYSLLDVFKVVRVHCKKIAMLMALAGIVGIIGSLALSNYYQATTSFYPASQDLVTPDKIFGGNKDLSLYGTREDLDRILTIGESRMIYEDLIREFNLFDRYDIDSSKAKSRSKVGLRLSKHYELMRTDRDAIELKVEDKDPQVAADMANFARDRIAYRASEMVRESQKGMIVKMTDDAKMRGTLVNQLSDSLKWIQQKYNIYNSASQSEYLSTEVATAEGSLAENKGKLEFLLAQPYVEQDSIIKIQAKIRGFEQKLKSMRNSAGGLFNLESYREGLPMYEQVKDAYLKELSQLNFGKMLLSQFKLTASSELPTIHVVEAAQAPDTKHRPKRSILVLGVVLLSFLCSVLAILFMEFWRKLNA